MKRVLLIIQEFKVVQRSRIPVPCLHVAYFIYSKQMSNLGSKVGNLFDSLTHNREYWNAVSSVCRRRLSVCRLSRIIIHGRL